jgi:DNA-binding PadR family transcriptional regulator
VLEEDGMVRLTKEGGAGRPQTTVRITVSGRKRYLDYLAILEQVVRDAASLQHREKDQVLVLSPLKA